MNFLAPAILAGLAALSLPVIIHLLNRLRVKKVRWAAMRFIAAAVKKQQRRVRVNDLFLLILRCLVLAALIFMFARPSFDRREVAAASDIQQTVMVLIDHSASMGQSDGIETRLEAAKRDALNYVENLREGSAAGLMLVTDSFTSPVARPSQDLGLVRRSIELTRLSDRSTNFAPAIRTAFQILGNTTGHREIRLFTDNQQIGWENLREVQQLLSDHPNIDFQVVTTGQQGEDNLAITDIRLDGGLPVVDQPLRVLVEVTNFSEAPVQALRVSLAVNDQAPSAEGVVNDLSPGGSRTVTLTTRLRSEGSHTLTATIPSDRLSVDNKRVLALEVVPPRRALIIESQPSSDPYTATGFFLNQALIPLSRDQRGSHYLQVDRRTIAQTTPDDISTAQFILLVDPDPIPPPLADLISQSVRDGAGLIIFPGSRMSPDLWQGEPWSNLLPALPGAVVDEGTSFAPGPYNHTLLTLWNNPGAGSLNRIRFDRYIPLSPLEDGENITLIHRLENGQPALMERGVGAGRVIMAPGVPVTSWGNLPLHPAFIPLTHRMVAQAGAQHSTRLNLQLGEVFQRTVSIRQINQDVYVRPPDAEPGSRPVALGRTELMGDRPTLRIRNTEMTGRYSVFIGQTQTPDFYFAVQPIPAESNLLAAPEDVIYQAEASAEATPVDLPAVSSTGWRPTAEQMWWWLLIAAAFFCAFELLIALRSSRAR